MTQFYQSNTYNVWTKSERKTLIRA